MAYRLADVPPSAEGGSTVITLSTEPNTVGTCSLSVPSPAGSSLSARSSLLGAERGGAAQGGLRSSLAPGRRAHNGSRRACRAQDAGVVDCFLVLAKAADASGESVMLLLRTLRFLRSCQYSEEDICLMLAHASIYFPDTYAATGPNMTSNEIGNVLVTLIFLAHCWVEDETCPLRTWHQHLFAQYCSLGTLSSAVLRLMELRGYILRVSSEVAERRTHALLAASEAAARACTPVPRPLPARSGYFGTHSQGSTFLRRGLETILDTCVSRARTDDG